MKSLQSQIIINATPETIWAVLMDFKNHSNWNPFIKQISGSTQIGKSLAVTVHPPNQKPMSFTPVVLKNEINSIFSWKGKLLMKGIFDGEHYFKLEAINKNQTRFIHGENFSGILSGLLLRMIGKDTLAGFEAMNLGLKKRVES